MTSGGNQYEWQITGGGGGYYGGGVNSIWGDTGPGATLYYGAGAGGSSYFGGGTGVYVAQNTTEAGVNSGNGYAEISIEPLPPVTIRGTLRWKDEQGNWRRVYRCR